MMARAVQAIERYFADDRGAAAAEFGLLAGLFLAIMLGIIDTGRLAWEVNAAKAATRAGVRFAIVNAPVVNQMNYDGTGTYGAGSDVPVGAVADYTCTSTSCGAGTRNAAAFNAILAVMQGYYPRLQAANVTVAYRHEGLGTAGNPYGSDVEPLITVSVQNLEFQPIITLLVNLTMDIPPVSSTMTAEDMA